jgi:hypothetical protein
MRKSTVVTLRFGMNVEYHYSLALVHRNYVVETDQFTMCYHGEYLSVDRKDTVKYINFHHTDGTCMGRPKAVLSSSDNKLCNVRPSRKYTHSSLSSM